MKILKGGVTMTNVLINENIEDFFSTKSEPEVKETRKINNRKFATILTFIKLKYSRAFDDIIKKYIVCDKNIRNGEATIKGTRITACDILYILSEARSDKKSIEYIYEQYPSITNKDQILAAILYMIKKTRTISMIISTMCS